MTGFFASFCDRLDRWSVSIFRRRAIRRLRSEIDTYENELKCRDGAKCAGLFDEARQAVNDGDIDRGWRFLQVARRIELGKDGTPELDAAAISIRREASKKLTSWRKETIEKLLSEDNSVLCRGKVYEAARICDEHFNNEAYKDGLRRSSARWLAIFLVSAVLLLFWISWHKYLLAVTTASDAPDFDLFKALVSTAVMGLLGAVISAITDLAKAGATTRIPELASTLRFTILRLLMGPASAIILYFVMQSDLSPKILQSIKSGYAVLVVAFAAGFSERLVLRVIRSFDEKSDK